jgi:hypothetical protein
MDKPAFSMVERVQLRGVPTTPQTRWLALAALAGLLLVAGCGSDSSGETSSSTSATSAAIPTVTSPLGTTSIATATTTAAKKGQPTTAGGGSANGCAIPDTYQDFNYTGLDCTAAVAVAQAWDANGKTCNTVDNPESPIGPQRTCSVNGYSCTAKRDIHSDARFVTCTQGGRSIRFTWLPA